MSIENNRPRADRRSSAQFRALFASEKDSAALYRGLAASADGERRQVFLELAAVEDRHAEHWAKKLTELGEPIPQDTGMGLRSKALSWLAKQSGVDVVLPYVERAEHSDAGRYNAHPHADPSMAVDERAHARVITRLRAAGQYAPPPADQTGRIPLLRGPGHRAPARPPGYGAAPRGYHGQPSQRLPGPGPEISYPGVYGNDMRDDVRPAYGPDVSNPRMYAPEVSDPRMPRPDFSDPRMQRPDLSNPRMYGPDVSNPNMFRPDPRLYQPDPGDPRLDPRMYRPDPGDPRLDPRMYGAPEIGNPRLDPRYDPRYGGTPLPPPRPDTPSGRHRRPTFDDRDQLRPYQPPPQDVPEDKEDVDADITSREKWHRSDRSGALRAAVFGVNDGLVSNTSLVMGFAGSGVSHATILFSGLAGLLAGAFSMAAGEYISMTSQKDGYEREIELEKAELEEDPAAEAEELALIYRAKGLPRADAERIASTIMADREVALETMSREELGLDPDELGSPWSAAGSSLVAFAAGAAVVVLPFLFGSGTVALVVAVTLAALALFSVGAVLGTLNGRAPIRSGLRQLAAGGIAGLVVFGIGHLIGTTVT